LSASDTSIWRHVAIVMVMLGVVAVSAPGLLLPEVALPQDQHARVSLDIALTRALCGAVTSVHSSAFSPGEYLQSHADARTVPLKQLIAQAAGSVDNYCRGAEPIVNNENSLMLIETTALRISPQLSLAQLGRRLHALRVVGLAFTSVVLLNAGFGVLWTAVFFAAGLALLHLLFGAVYSVYAFLPVLVVTVAGLGIVAVQYATGASRAHRVAAGVIAGAVTIAGANLRTSYAPVLLAMFAVAAFMCTWEWRRLAGASQASRSLAEVSAAFIVGALITHVLVVGRLAVPSSGAASYHAIGHPLVLSLALPPSDLSRREGIEWNDSVGLAIARRTSPDVAYLGGRYEQILLEYYASLWRGYPREMAGIYAEKIRLAGSDVVANLSWTPGALGRVVPYVMAPAALLTNGWWVALAYLTMTAGAAATFLRTRSPVAAGVTLFGVAAILLQLETALIMPYYFLPYQGYLALFAVVFSIVVYRLAVLGAVRGAQAVAALPVGRAWLERADAVRRARFSRQFVNDAFLFHEPRPFRRSVLYLAVLLVAARVLFPSSFQMDAGLTNDGHGLASLELALSRALCGKPSAYSPSIRVPYEVRDHPELRIVPMRDLILRHVPDMDAFCQSASQPFVNNENALMLLESWILRVRPAISVAGLAKALSLIRIAGVCAFVLLLIDLGSSLSVAAAVLLASLSLMRGMQEHALSVYPFLFVLVIAAVALYGFALKYGATRTIGGGALLGVVAGAYTGFGVNMRTSYLPVYLALALCFLVADQVWWRPSVPGVRAQLGRALVVMTCFVAGYFTLQYLGITRNMPPAVRYNAASHSIAHPLVLSLGVPQNDLSRREGIDWLDAAGIHLAQRMIPDAVYLGPTYDEALFKYYRYLWKTYPREMTRVYIAKFSLTGSHMLTIISAGGGSLARVKRLLVAPLRLLPNGIWLLALYAAIATVSAVLALRNRSAAAFALSLLSIAACLLHVESAVIMPLYVPNYHNYLACYAELICLFAWQAAAQVAWRVATVLRGQPR
jgi:hypothetical protein